MSTATASDLEGIAIVGMAGRFPGARTVSQLWKNLCEGVESISSFSDEELIAGGVDPSVVRAPNYIKAGGVLGDTELFDAAFFGLNPREAALMDPQHRLFLECAWEAMESAGYSPDRQPGRVGVFGGLSMNTYLLTNVYGHLAHVASVESLQASIGNDKDSMTTEVAYRMNLTGPAVTIQSSSSTSLVVVHYACQSLLNYECNLALAGGVSIHFPEKAGYLYYEGGTTSPDGHCRPFDSRAKGFVSGHGAGVVALRRLSDALADGDTIYAVIRGSAVNNDGSKKVSYMAPSVEGQAEVIALAQAVAGVEPDSISYVEAHGTATPMGDPIEIAALTQAFRAGTDRKGFCAIGSVKSNIGHLDSAAGVTGLIKAALSLHHRRIPPTLHFQAPNPAIDFAGSPFYVNAQLAEWPPGKTPRRAGVTSLGMGGTNAHCILEETPALPAVDAPRRPAQLLLLSARTATALEAATDLLAAHLGEHPEPPLADVAHTLQVGRKRFGQRRMLVCRSADDARAALASRDPERVLGGADAIEGRPVMFMFTGQGAQHVDMGRQLYETEPAFRAEVDTCAELLEGTLGVDLRSVLYPPADGRAAAEERLAQTAFTQPALFVLEHALARLWMAWGIKPQAMIGHSIGEYVAACLAGVFSLQDALSLVAARGRLMQGMAPGAMLAVPLPEAEIRALLDGGLDLAAVNSPSSGVVAGPSPAVDALAERLAARGVSTTRLHTSHAFHSAMMDPALDAFRDAVRRVTLAAPRLPYLSNVTGRWITAEEATSPDYWARHLRQAVRFSDGLGELLKEEDALLLEVGPGQTLGTFARAHPAKGPRHVVIPSLRHPRDPRPDVDFLLGALGRLWLSGVEPDWDAFRGEERRRRVALPAHPFERQRHWVEPKPLSAAPAAPAADQKLDVSRWLSLASWQRSLGPPPAKWDEGRACWWLFLPREPGQGDLGALLLQRLSAAGQDVVTIQVGAGCEELAPGRWAVDPRQAAGFETLVQRLLDAGHAPDRILHLWSALPEASSGAGEASFETAQDLGFRGVLSLAQALGRRGPSRKVSLLVVTQRMQAVGEELPCPEQATVLGPCRVIPQEYPWMACKSVDLSLPVAAGWQQAALVEPLLAECAARAGDETVVAYRGRQRWVQRLEPVPAEAGAAGGVSLRDRGVYLVLGGLGRLGFAHAEVLARRARARLVLVNRTALPERSGWDAHLAAHLEGDPLGLRMLKVRQLEALGAEVLVASADVADRSQVRAVVEQAVARFGALHGVVFAAGEVGTALLRTIQETGPAEVQAIFRSRVEGLYALEEALRGRSLDFCILASSLASVLGGVGRAAYAAATCFMNAFAMRQAQGTEVPWLSVGWDAWQFEVDGHAPEGTRPLQDTAMTAEEGREVFARILRLGTSAPLAVSTCDLHARLARALRVEPGAEQEAGAGEGQEPAAGSQRAPRPALQNIYVAPRDEMEQTIAREWEETLGISQVGVHDNFFDLGGNSLVGVKLVARLRDRFGLSFPAVTLYEGPTVHALAKLLKASAGGDTGQETEATAEGQSRGERRRARRQRKQGGAAGEED